MDKKNRNLSKGSKNTLRSEKHALPKQRNSSSRYMLAGIIIFGIILASIGAYVIYNASGSDFVAQVGSEKISSSEFKFYLNSVKAEILKNVNNPDPNMFWNTKIDGENALDVAKRKALEYAEEAKVQLIKAKEAKITLDKNTLDSINNYESTVAQQINGTRADAENYIKQQYGVSIGELKEIMKESYIINKFRMNETINIKVSDSDLEDYYKKNPDVFKDSLYRSNAEEAVWARHILILTMDMSNKKELPADKQEEAKKKAEELLERARNGEDFAKLARENSEDAGSAQYGGDYVFGKGRMDPEFEKAAFSLKPGEISGLVKTTYGYHIIKLEEKIPQGQPVSLKCAKGYREFGMDKVKSDMYQKQLQEQMKDYTIKINQTVYNSIK